MNRMKKLTCLMYTLFFSILMNTLRAYAVEEGSITVTTDPEGVEVWLDDKYLGDSPIENRKLKTGRYTIKLVDPIQQVSATEEVLIQPNQTTLVEKTLKAKFGTLKVDSDPEGAEVYISTSLGKTPLENNFMNPGKYRIDIKHPKTKYEPVTEEITIPAGKTVELENTLVKTSKFDKKAIVRLVLGAGAIGCFVWAIIEQGVHKENQAYADDLKIQQSTDVDKIQEYEDEAEAAAVKRTIGIIGGSLCVIGFEIVAFF